LYDYTQKYFDFLINSVLYILIGACTYCTTVFIYLVGATSIDIMYFILNVHAFVCVCMCSFHAKPILKVIITFSCTATNSVQLGFTCSRVVDNRRKLVYSKSTYLNLYRFGKNPNPELGPDLHIFQNV